MYVSDAISYSTAACLVFFVLAQFRVPRRSWILLAFGVSEAALIWYLGPVPIGGGVSLWRPDPWIFAFITALLCSLWAAVKGKKDTAWLVSGGLAMSLYLYARDPIDFIRTQFLATSLPALMAFLAAMAVSVRRERREAQGVKLMAARLEIDLLKRSLQPHFLMNTLTTLAQIVEEDPKVAVRLIDDLAFEFRSLNAISGLTSIPLVRELELCAAHLRVMTVRTERPWRLEVSGITQEAIVPPALFLTLIENGFSHQRAEDGSTTFSLRAEGTAKAPRYTFYSPGVVGAVAEGREGGVGLRYVRVRLEELWPSRWKLSQQEVTGGWQTVIDLAGPERTGLAS